MQWLYRACNPNVEVSAFRPFPLKFRPCLFVSAPVSLHAYSELGPVSGDQA